MNTWEVTLMYASNHLPKLRSAKLQVLTLLHYRTASFTLINGGLAGLVWGYLLVWVGFMLVFATIAEMASM